MALVDYERADRYEIGGRLIAGLPPAWRILLFFVIVTLPAAGQDAASQIRAEIQRVQQSLKDRPITDPDAANLSTAVEGELKAASETVSAGAIYLSLQRLGQAMDLLQGARAVADKKAEIVKSGLPAFEAEWGKVSLVLNEREQKARGRDWSKVPAAVRALAETSQVMATPLMDGGRALATTTQPKDGLFNIGQARGEAEFEHFCASLQFARKASALLRRSSVITMPNARPDDTMRGSDCHPWPASSWNT